MQALGIALKLTFQGENQFVFIETYFCILVGLTLCIAEVLVKEALRGSLASSVLLYMHKM